MVPITLRQVTRQYGPHVVVDHVDLEVEAGELFFLLGPSGCGKTTLLRMIAGLVEPSAGTILLGDRDVTGLPTGQRNTAMVFQNYALWPHMTVAENVAFGLDVRRLGAAEKKQRVEDALAAVRMEGFEARKPAQLSGGQQQRVALARALAVQPAVLLLDEPLSNLDAKLRLELRGEIRRICNESRLTAVYVTHDQEEALSMADRMAVIDQGRICQVGTPKDLYARPATRFVADFLGQTNFLPARTVGLEAGRLLLNTPIGRLRSTSCPPGIPADIEVTCSIRLEAVRFIDAQAQADNRLEGRVIETVYRGFMAQHTVAVGDAFTLRLNEFKPRLNTAVNGPVQLGFDAEDVVVLLR